MDATIAIGDIEFVVKFFSIRITNVPGSSFEGKLCFWLRMRSAIRWNEVGTRPRVLMLRATIIVQCFTVGRHPGTSWDPFRPSWTFIR